METFPGPVRETRSLTSPSAPGTTVALLVARPSRAPAVQRHDRKEHLSSLSRKLPASLKHLGGPGGSLSGMGSTVSLRARRPLPEGRGTVGFCPMRCVMKREGLINTKPW